MKNNIIKNTYYLFFALAVIELSLIGSANASSITNNIRVYSITGEKTDNSTDTGSASAKSSVRTEVSGTGEMTVSTDIEAYTNGNEESIKNKGEGEVSIHVESNKMDGQVQTISDNENETNEKIQIPTAIRDMEDDGLENETSSTEGGKSVSQDFFENTEEFRKLITNFINNIL